MVTAQWLDHWQLESKALVSTLKNDQFISHRDTPMKQEE